MMNCCLRTIILRVRLSKFGVKKQETQRRDRKTLGTCTVELKGPPERASGNHQAQSRERGLRIEDLRIGGHNVNGSCNISNLKDEDLEQRMDKLNQLEKLVKT